MTQQQPKLIINSAQLNNNLSSIFARREDPQKKFNIFQNKKSINLFNIKKNQQNISTVNIFQKAINAEPIIKSKDQDEQEKQSQNGANQEQQKLSQPTQKIMKYQYKNNFQKIEQFRLIKFRRGTQPLKEGVFLSLEKDNQNSIVLFLMIRSDATKVLLYHAIVVKQWKPQNILGKGQNIKIGVLKLKENCQQKSGQKQLLKLQFENTEKAESFKSQIDKFFNSQKKQETQHKQIKQPTQQKVENNEKKETN